MLKPATRQLTRPALRVVGGACHDGGGSMPQPRAADQLTVALVGQPNVGKSTVFNMLTGLSQHVGNWPGKTVEQKTGTLQHDGVTLDLVDLPGTYSLTANSEEERIARDYLIREKPDLVIAIVNAAALERSLYLTAELLALDVPLVVGLNMSDVAEQHGIHVEPHVLSAALGLPVISLVASKNVGVHELVDEALKLAAAPDEFRPNRPTIRPEHRPVLEALRRMIAGHVPAPYPEDWVALKLLEGDSEITALVEASAPPDVWKQMHGLLLQHEDAYLDIAGGRYEWVGRMVRAAVTQPKAGAVTRTERIDRVATHPIGGLLLLLAMFGAVFWLTYTIATPISNWLATWVLGTLDAIAAATLSWAPPWLYGLVTGGLIHGVGAVFTFLPILVIFFAALGMPGRRRLSVARRLCHGPLHAPDGAARQVVHAVVPGLRLQRPGRARRPHHRGSPRPPADHPAGAAGAVYGAAGRGRFPDTRLLPRRMPRSFPGGWWRSACWSWPSPGSSSTSWRSTASRRRLSWSCPSITYPTPAPSDFMSKTTPSALSRRPAR